MGSVMDILHVHPIMPKQLYQPEGREIRLTVRVDGMNEGILTHDAIFLPDNFELVIWAENTTINLGVRRRMRVIGEIK